MAKNLSRKDRPAELDFEEPRDPQRMGVHYADPKEEIADPGHRDGMAALLDDDAHERAVRRAVRKRQASEPKSGSNG